LSWWHKILTAWRISSSAKIQREQMRFQITIADKRRKEREFGKMAKEIMKEKKKNKY